MHHRHSEGYLAYVLSKGIREEGLERCIVIDHEDKVHSCNWDTEEVGLVSGEILWRNKSCEGLEAR